MGFELVDRYLLGEPVSKAELVDVLLASRSSAEATAPFYRALEAVGARAADEAFIALRLVAAGKEASDDNVKRLRALSNVARACAAGDAKGLAKIVSREGAQLRDLPTIDGSHPDLPSIGSAARDAYAREVTS